MTTRKIDSSKPPAEGTKPPEESTKPPAPTDPDYMKPPAPTDPDYMKPDPVEIELGPFVILGDDPEDPAVVGDELTARPNSVVPAEDYAGLDDKSETFQWIRDGNDIKGETDHQYTLTSADGGTTITCRYSFILYEVPYEVLNNDPVVVPKENEPKLDGYSPIDVSLYSSHYVVYGYAPTKTTMSQLRSEYVDKGKALSDIIRNMENKASA